MQGILGLSSHIRRVSIKKKRFVEGIDRIVHLIQSEIAHPIQEVKTSRTVNVIFSTVIS